MTQSKQANSHPEQIVISKKSFDAALYIAVRAACDTGIFPCGDVPVDIYERNYANIETILRAAFAAIDINIKGEMK